MEKLKLSYQIKPEEWLEGYDLYYKKFRQKSTVIRATLFLIPLALFFQQVFIDPNFVIGWVCIAVCIAAIFCIFANRRMERRVSEHALEGMKDDKYQLTLFDDKLTVETLIPENQESQQKAAPTVIEFSEKSYSAVETENIFAVMTKEVCITVPKENLSKYDIETLRDVLKAIPDERRNKRQ